MIYLAQRSSAENPATQRVLQAVDGYLYLGMPKEALAELDSIELLAQGHSAVLLTRIRILLHSKRWQDAQRLAARCSAKFPGIEEFAVQRAFALQQMKMGDEAMNVILAVPDWIRRTGIIHYNLACYEARLGDLSIARLCINAAIQMNAAMKRNARRDPDLQALYN